MYFRPQQDAAGEQWDAAIRSLQGSSAFRTFLASVEAELARLDEQNRIPGCENKVSGAGVLADMLTEIAACWKSGTHRSPTNEPGLGDAPAET